jgi:hypothetical protein
VARPFAKLKFMWKLIDWVGELSTIPLTWIKPVFSLQWGWADPTKLEKPNFRNLRVCLLGAQTIRTGTMPTLVTYKNNGHKNSLYYNGVLFIRLMLPFFIGVQIRWAGNKRRSYLQTHVGWKLNGRFAVAFRIQGDESAARGMDFPNPGQAQGWNDGGK